MAGGYEWLFLSADDPRTASRFEATYGGWGWQVWGGLALPLSGRARLSAEVFRNGAEVSRDVYDGLLGYTVREKVTMDGTGLRFGVQLGF